MDSTSRASSHLGRVLLYKIYIVCLGNIQYAIILLVTINEHVNSRQESLEPAKLVFPKWEQNPASLPPISSDPLPSMAK
jgi:hypothetical protein